MLSNMSLSPSSRHPQTPASQELGLQGTPQSPANEGWILSEVKICKLFRILSLSKIEFGLNFPRLNWITLLIKVIIITILLHSTYNYNEAHRSYAPMKGSACADIGSSCFATKGNAHPLAILKLWPPNSLDYKARYGPQPVKRCRIRSL